MLCIEVRMCIYIKSNKLIAVHTLTKDKSNPFQIETKNLLLKTLNLLFPKKVIFFFCERSSNDKVIRQASEMMSLILFRHNFVQTFHTKFISNKTSLQRDKKNTSAKILRKMFIHICKKSQHKAGCLDTRPRGRGVLLHCVLEQDTFILA